MYLKIFFLTFFSCVTNLYAQAVCNPTYVDHQVEEVVATANTLANSISATGSLSFETKRLLEKAQSVQPSIRSPLTKCPTPCVEANESLIVFTTIPNQFLETYSDKTQCQEMQNKTTASPFIFNPELFKSMDKFSLWFADFSRGSGKEGKELYRQCPGACSPQYTVDITAQDDKVNAVVRVICGEARDKSDNHYKVSTSLRWTCSAPN